MILLVIVVILFCVPFVLCWRRWRHELPLEVGAGKARTVRVQPIGHSSDEIQRDRFKDPKHSYFAEKRKRARVVLERRAKRRKLRGTHHGCQINAQPWGVQTSRVSMTHAQDVIDPTYHSKITLAGRSRLSVADTGIGRVRQMQPAATTSLKPTSGVCPSMGTRRCRTEH